MALIITYEKLKQKITESEGFDYVLNLAKEFKFPTTSFLSGSVGYTVLKIQGAILALISDSISEISKQIYVDESSGAYLTLLADNFFDTTRFGETQTVIEPVIVTAGATPGPKGAETVKIMVGDVEFYNTDAFTIEANNPTGLQVQFTSTDFGADTRVATNIVPVFSQNVIGNATFKLISNDDGYFRTITNGQDEETDTDLKTRCKNKWGLLTTLGPEAAYAYWVMSATRASDGQKVDITRIKIDRSEAQTIGHLVIYCASSTGTASVEDLADADLIVQQKRSINASVHLDQVVESVFLYKLDVTVNSAAEKEDIRLRANILQCIKNYLSTIDIGGVIIDAGEQGYVIFAQIVEDIMTLPGVMNVTINELLVDNVLQTEQDIQIAINKIPTISDVDTTNYMRIIRI